MENGYQKNIKDQLSINVFICKTSAHLIGLSDDFDGGRIKERRVIAHLLLLCVPCSHIVDKLNPNHI